ncbi:MAG: tRNA (pseudouridine(54)-N(1))-methyltransferase TrmY [Euryarchaeota archaeon]|nr:tRNA (pseudouridine(54)-N(1))-methyltransferase TrmY [Euryarchaeota archaeon]
MEDASTPARPGPAGPPFSTWARRFLIVGHKARTDGDFNLKDVPGTSGRLDVLARCLTTGLLISNGIRKDTAVYLLLRGPPGPMKVLRFDGASLKNLNPDERSAATLVQAASRVPVGPGGWLEVATGIAVALADEALFKAEFSDLTRVILSEGGEDLDRAAFEKAVVILGGHTDVDEADLRLLRAGDAVRIRLGPLSLHADQCVTVVHHVIDSKVGRKGGSAALKLLGG